MLRGCESFHHSDLILRSPSEARASRRMAARPNLLPWFETARCACLLTMRLSVRNSRQIPKIERFTRSFAGATETIASTAQHHQRVERDGALAFRQGHKRIDIDAFDLVAEILRKPPERSERGEHAFLVASACSPIALEHATRGRALDHGLALPWRQRHRAKADVLGELKQNAA